MCEAAGNSQHDTGSERNEKSLRIAEVKQSTVSRWRAASLITVHILMIAHVIHWAINGTTLSPVEPSEAMYTLNRGEVNAGFIFFAVTLLGTLVAGRFLCGWGCHMIAYQDLCAWLLKKVGIRPRAFRSRLLVFAPLGLACYMFLWPTVYRLCTAAPLPELTNHLMTSQYWKTFPGPIVGLLTIAICGFLIIYILGSKGFCTFACPYGGLYGLADRLAPGRIRVTDACAGCGHCTAACTSNVRVHEEVARFGMVVDPGCMKCMDCVSVCPTNALYFGFTRPPIGMSAKAPRKPLPPDLRLWEEVAAAFAFVVTLLIYRGLYGQIPLLLAAALAVITTYFLFKSIDLVRKHNVRLQNLTLRKGGRLTRAGFAFVSCTALLFVFVGHSSTVQYNAWKGHTILSSLSIGDQVWKGDHDWWNEASTKKKTLVNRAIVYLERTNSWGLAATPAALQDLAWLYLAKDLDDKAEDAIRSLIALRPNQILPHRGLAWLLKKKGRIAEAEKVYRHILSLDKHARMPRQELGAILCTAGRDDEAIKLYHEAIDISPGQTWWPVQLCRLLISMNRLEEACRELDALLTWAPRCTEAHALRGAAAAKLGNAEDAINHFKKAVELDPGRASGHYDLGMAYLALSQLNLAAEHLRLAITHDPEMAVGHYNLAVVKSMIGEVDEAIAHAEEAIRLDPDDPTSAAFLEYLRRGGNDPQQ